MSLVLLRFLAMTIGPSITAAARPAATFLGVQLVVALLVHQDLAAVPQMMQWLISAPAIVAAAVLAGLETAAKHDPDIAAILRDMQVDNVTGAFGAFSAALLFAALDMPEVEAAALVDGAAGSMDNPMGESTGNQAAESGGVLGAVATAAASEHRMEVQATAVGLAIGLNLGLTWLRSQLLEFIDDFELGRMWARIETGGVVGVLILLPLLPLVAFGFLIFLTAVLATVALTARAAQRVADRRARVPCKNCDYQVREEASLCPKCKTERQPTAEPASGIGAAWKTFRKTPKESAQPAS